MDVGIIMNTDLQQLGQRLVGRWSSEATHRGLPGALIRGFSEFEWLDGDRFVIYRSSYDHPDIPDSISILGDTDGLRMHYFDSRGVHRTFEVTVTDHGWAIAMDRHASAGSFASSDAPFSQRITYAFEDDDRVMSGTVELSHDNVSWDDDMTLRYRRAS